MANTITVANVQITMSVKGAAKAKTDIDNTNKSVKNLGANSKGAAAKVGELWTSLKRIATYRLLRTAIKSITQGLSEGVKNLYQWSKMGDGKFAASMDRMSTALLQMKNSMAVALAPLIENVIVPLMEKLSSIFIAASDQISMFAARLKGETKYLSVATAATKAFAEAQRSILGFDEINKLGSSSSTDYSNMFEYVSMPETSMSIQIADMYFDTKNLDENSIMAKLSALFNGLTGGLIGWSIGGVGGGLTGVIAGVGLSMLVSSLLFNGDSLDDNYVSGKLMEMLTVSCAILGLKLGGLNGALIGGSIGLSLSLIIEYMNIKDKTGITAVDLTDMVVGSLGAAGGALIASALGLSTLAAGVVGITLGVVLTLTISKIQKSWDDNKIKFDDSGNMVYDPTNSLGTSDYFYGSSTVSGNSLPGTSKYKTRLSTYGLAGGGFPTEGSMFIAGEAGPELVGNIGGRTGVMNTDQMAESLASANTEVVNAIYQIANTITNAINNQPVPSIKIGDREIYKASQRGARTIGGSLVQGV